MREHTARTSQAFDGESEPSADSSPKSWFTAQDQKFAAPSKAKSRGEPAGVASGNGEERRRTEEEFEEF
jgi:hypothetical protein